jgi:hypothetical protein
MRIACDLTDSLQTSSLPEERMKTSLFVRVGPKAIMHHLF